MAWSFNVFTGNLDQTGSGAVVFEGEVETFADLPETIGDPAVGASYLVRTSTGVWLVNRRQAGIWIRKNNTGVRATDWEYGGDYPVNSVNGQTGNVSLTAADVGAAASTHGSTHHTGGTDAIAPNNISAQWALAVSSQFISGNTLLSAGRNRRITLSAIDQTVNIDLPYSDNLDGDTVTLIASGGLFSGSTLSIRTAGVMSGGSPVGYVTLATLNAAGQSYTFVSDGTATGWSLRAVDTHTHAASAITSGTLDIARIPTGTSSSTVAIGNDARLSDSRTPTAHAASHAAGGSDPVFDQDLNTTDSPTFAGLTVDGTAVAGQTPDTVLRGGAWFGAPAGAYGIGVENQAAGVFGVSNDFVGFGGFNEAVTVYNDIAFYAGNFPQLFLSTSGNVGIQTGNPQATLDVAGNVIIRDLDGNQTATFDAQGNLTDDRTYDLPDANGTLALTSQLQGEVRSDFVTPYTYTGIAPAGTATSASSWTIRRSQYDSAGTPTATLTATSVKWDDRLTASYS